MIPVTQTTFGKDNGNCFAACIASILELPLEEVPHFCSPENGDDWWMVFMDWCLERGMKPEVVNSQHGPNGYSILSGKSPRGDFYHSVVAKDGVMVHDPHPDNTGVEDILDWIVMKSIKIE